MPKSLILIIQVQGEAHNVCLVYKWSIVTVFDVTSAKIHKVVNT